MTETSCLHYNFYFIHIYSVDLTGAKRKERLKNRLNYMLYINVSANKNLAQPLNICAISATYNK